MANLSSIIGLLLGAMIIWAMPAHADQELIVPPLPFHQCPERGGRGIRERPHPGTKIVCNFAASGSLLQQIAQGAPVDVFASADQKTMDQAQEKGLIIPASRKNFVSNILCSSRREIQSASGWSGGPGLAGGKTGGPGQSRNGAGGTLHPGGLD